MKSRLKKFFLISLALIIASTAGLFLYAHFVCGTSVTAMAAAFYMEMTDFNKIYESEENANKALEDLRLPNLRNVEKPGMTNTIASRLSGKMQYFTVGDINSSDTLIFYFPGGGFINQPKSQHWKLIDKINVQTGYPVIVPIYLKVTSYNCDDAYAEIMELYKLYADSTRISKMIFMGDSSGANLALSLAMQLRDAEIRQPDKLILISPWMDLSMTNEEMEALEEDEFMTGIDGLRVFGKKWAGDRNVLDPVVSPLYGNFTGLGEIVIFSGTKDMLHPDILLFEKRLITDKADYTLYIGENLPHVYPLFPTPEAKDTFTIMQNELSF